MTNVERVSLIHQLEILKAVGSTRYSDYDVLIEALENGYDEEVQRLYRGFDEFVSKEDRAEVREILEMFRALGPREGGKIPAAAKFAGFDGNEESGHYCYAQFLIERKGSWRESNDVDLNSHCNMLEHYREMLREWYLSADKWNLTKEDIDRILKFAPHMSI